MDLDKLKKDWQELDATPSSISEEKIKKMMDNKGQSALSKLKRMERIFLILILFCVGVPFLHNYIFGEKLGYNLFMIVLYVSFCVIAIFSQLYKLTILKKIDLEKSDILTCSKQILWIRKYLTMELFVGLIFAITMMVAFGVHTIKILPEYLQLYYTIYIVLLTAILIVVLLLFYRATYRKYINQVKQSIDEVKEFEE